jgi:LacI family transcriptional regulator
VVGIGTGYAFGLMHAALATLRFGIERAVEAAVQLALDRINGKAAAGPRHVNTALELMIGASCAAR